jgi:hypothetical protein
LASTTGGAWQINLYTAVGNSGRQIRIKKTTNDISVLTIEGNASETIDGATSYKLNTRYEQVTLVSDGSNWHVLEHIIPSKWEDVSSLSWTFNGLTVGSKVIFARREGDSWHVRGWVSPSATSGTTAGIVVPTADGYTIDAAKIASGTDSGLVGRGGLMKNASTVVPYFHFWTSGGNQIFYSNTSAGYTFEAKAANGFIGASEIVQFDFIVPITGWEP